MAAPDEEWELVNDDGFVYKRKKRRPDPTHLVRLPDPKSAAEQSKRREKEKRKLKRKILLKLKDKYEREIHLWEDLSSTLKAMEQTAKSKSDMETDGDQQQQQLLLLQVNNESFSGSLLNQVLAQVEQQEAIIRGVSRLCDVAESLCGAQDEKTKHTFFNLPVWASPCELMASLCED